MMRVVLAFTTSADILIGQFSLGVAVAPRLDKYLNLLLKLYLPPGFFLFNIIFNEANFLDAAEKTADDLCTKI